MFRSPTKKLPPAGRARAPPSSRLLHTVLIAQTACGFALALVSCAWLESIDAAWGFFLGLMAAVVGFSGIAGTTKRALNLVNASFASGLLVLPLIIGFNGKVHRQAAVDCAIAELLAIEDAAKFRLEHSESWKGSALGTVQMRLDALDSTLDLLETRADLVAPLRVIDKESAASELRHEHQRALWTASDTLLVAAKLAKAKEHGMKVLGQLFKLGIDPGGKIQALEDLAAAHLPAGDVSDLQQRFNNLFSSTERMVRRIREHEEGGNGPVSAEEYKQLLLSLEDSMQTMATFLRRMEVAVGMEYMPLTHADFIKLMHGLDLDEEVKETAPRARRSDRGADPTLFSSRLPLQSLHEDTAMVSDALHRHSHTDDGYAAVRSIGADALQESWRRQWEAQLAERLPVGEESDVLSRLPKRCVEENWGAWVVSAFVAAVAVTQSAGLFCMLSVAGRLPGSARSLVFD